PQGVWLVALTGHQPGDELWAELARVLGIDWASGGDLAATIGAALGDSTVMLLLDACEHAPREAATVATFLLGAGPGVRVLATSREPLRVSGECRYAVAPLDVRGAGAENQDRTPAAGRSAAEKLFLQRMSEAGGPRTTGEADLEMVSDIVTQLDGLPLAIELAAGRAATMPLQTVRAGLADRFTFLDTPGGGLRGTIEWSWANLDARQAAAMAALSVFAGGFTIDSATRILPAAGVSGASVPALVSDLVERSLVAWTPALGRDRLLDTVRAFARSRLEAGRQSLHVQDEHAAWIAGLATDAAPRLASADREPALETLDREGANVTAALRHALERGHTDRALTISGHLGWWWYHRATFSEGRRWIAQALHLTGGTDHRARSIALTAAARLAFYDGDLAESQQLANDATRLARSLGDPHTLGYALYVEALAAQGAARPEAVAYAREAIAHLTAARDPWGTALAVFYLGVARLMTNQDDEGLSAFQEAIERFDDLGDAWGSSGARFYTGVILHRRGDRPTGRALVEEAAAAFRLSGDRWRLKTTLVTLADMVEQDDGDASELHQELTAMP
ncbi:MAG TPA: hypothetical protein VML54_08040, partial [Candidatus Limnocylindrales bacterium]|nr:hypothetical protein [Candidatus Limnocylindrales bacterium]